MSCLDIPPGSGCGWIQSDIRRQEPRELSELREKERRRGRSRREKRKEKGRKKDKRKEKRKRGGKRTVPSL